MFWRFNVINTQIDTLLDREDVTLQEILDEDDVLQECKAQNPRLLEFLVKQENMDELVNWVTSEPKEGTDDTNSPHLQSLSSLDVQAIPEKLGTYKFPNIACELLTSDCPQITEKLASEETYLAKVYSFLESEGTVNPLLASFFSKVMGLLIARKSELMLDFLKTKDDCVSHMLRHIGTSAIMDLLLRLITCIESPETRLACVNWLNDQSIIQKLVGLIDAEHSEDKHCNASQSLCDIIRLSRDQMSQLQERADPDPLLATIESTETVSDLLDHMFRTDNKVESVVINGLQVIQTLLEFRKPGYGPDGCQEMTALDRERLELGISNTMKAVIPRLKDFHQVLIDPPKQHYHNMPTTLGNLDPPLGNTRLQTVRLICSILVSNSSEANLQLKNLSTLGNLLDLFFKYSLNNFLHTQVETCLCTVLNSNLVSSPPSAEETESEQSQSSQPLLRQLLGELNLIERILEAWEENEQNQTRPGGHRKGYMGHLTHIANTIVECEEKGFNAELIKELLKELDEDLSERWKTFTSSSLSEANKTNTLQMVGGNALHSSSDSEDTDFSNIQFPQDSAMQQAFSDYQLHQMTSTFIDQFGFKEDEFTENEERVDAPFNDRISSINFDINSVEQSTAAASLFEQACSERVQQFDEEQEGDEEDPWEEKWQDKEVTFSKDAKPSNTEQRTPPAQRRQGTADDEDDEESGEQPNRGSSDESTDSDEELTSSPGKIYQTLASSDDGTTSSEATPAVAGAGAENMDVSEDFANFDNMHVAMETGNSNDDWAKFDELPSSTKNGAEDSGEGWADFSNLEDMESSEIASSSKEERSGSPVAMDTADTSASSSNRMAQYLVTEGNEATSSTGEAESSTAETPSSSNTDANTSSPPSTPRSAWGSSVDTSSATTPSPSSAPDTPRPSDDKRPTFTPASSSSGSASASSSQKVPASPDTNAAISSTTGDSSAQSSEKEASSEATSSEDSSISSSKSESSQSEPISSSSENASTENHPTTYAEAVAQKLTSEDKEPAETPETTSTSETMDDSAPMESSDSEPEKENSSSSQQGTSVESSEREKQRDSAPQEITTHTENESPESSSVEENKPEQNQEVNEELEDNFDFLSGLMGRRSTDCTAKASEVETKETSVASSTQDSEVNSSSGADDEASKLEAMRAQARDALGEFSSATSTSNQNGPVA